MSIVESAPEGVFEKEHMLSERVGASCEIPVSIIPELDFSKHFLFPFETNVEILRREFARVVDRNAQGASYLQITPGTGRGAFMETPAQYHGKPLVNFTTLYVKGSGIGDIEQAVSAIGGSYGSRGLLMREWQKKTPQYAYQRGWKEVGGAMILADANLDSHTSLRMHAKGLRVRLPVATFRIDALPVNGKLIPVSELERAGWPVGASEEKEPVLSLWAKRYPFTFVDLNVFLYRAKSFEKERQMEVGETIITSLIDHLMATGDLQIETIKDKSIDAQEHMLFTWIAKTFGQQRRIMKEKIIYHMPFSEHNLSPAVEFSDTSASYVGSHPLEAEESWNSQNLYLNILTEGFIIRLKDEIDKARSVSPKDIHKNRVLIHEAFEQGYNN
jgi:hypothetical protein